MGLVYSALAGAAPSSPIIGKVLTPINWSISSFYWLTSPVFKVWNSEIVQGALADAFAINDVYLKYVFPYVMFGTFLLVSWGPDTTPMAQRFMKLQIRFQIDQEVEKNPKSEHRYAERWGLV